MLRSPFAGAFSYRVHIATFVRNLIVVTCKSLNAKQLVYIFDTSPLINKCTVDPSQCTLFLCCSFHRNKKCCVNKPEGMLYMAVLGLQILKRGVKWSAERKKGGKVLCCFFLLLLLFLLCFFFLLTSLCCAIPTIWRLSQVRLEYTVFLSLLFSITHCSTYQAPIFATHLSHLQ